MYTTKEGEEYMKEDEKIMRAVSMTISIMESLDLLLGIKASTSISHISYVFIQKSIIIFQLN